MRRIMLASAAIPGAFPPTMIDVSLDDKPYQEMHVDSGTFAQAFCGYNDVMRIYNNALRDDIRYNLPTSARIQRGAAIAV